MKTIGFLKEYESRVLGDHIIYEYSGEILPIFPADREKVIAYLNGGKYVFGMTLAIEDKDGNYMGAYLIRTDGQWLWPEYFIYNIIAGRVASIPIELYDRIKSFDFLTPEVLPEEQTTAVSYIEKILLERDPKLKARLKDLK